MMEKAMRIAELFAQGTSYVGKTAEYRGGCERAGIESRHQFIELNDGSCLKSLQIIAEHNHQGYGSVWPTSPRQQLLVEGPVLLSRVKGSPLRCARKG